MEIITVRVGALYLEIQPSFRSLLQNERIPAAERERWRRRKDHCKGKIIV